MSLTSDPGRFLFERDTFTFANELVWLYRFDPVTGKASPCRREPPPTYALHCFVLARATRQFFYHARFDPAAPPLADAACHQRICSLSNP